LSSVSYWEFGETGSRPVFLYLSDFYIHKKGIAYQIDGVIARNGAIKS